MKIKLLSLLLLSTPLHAQLPLSDYRQEVLGYSLEIKKSEISTISSAEGVAKSQTLRLPTLSLGGNFDYSMRSIDGQKSWRFNLQPQLTQTLYGGGGVAAEIESARLSHKVALCSREFTLLEVIYSADYAYWNLLSTTRYYEVVKRYVEIVASLKALIDRRFVEGYVPKSDVLMIATRLSEAEYGLVSVEQLHEVALHNFNILRGTPPTELVELVKTNATTLPPPQRVALEQILERRPDYVSAQLNSEIYKTAIRSTKAAYNPTLSVGVQGNWAPNIPNYNGRTNIDGIAFIQLSSTIFHFGERRRAVSIAHAAHMSSEIDEKILHDSILGEETNGWTTLIDRRAQVTSSAEALDIASESLDINTYSYSEGEASILDVMQAQLSWIQIYTNYINAEFNYLVAVSSYKKIIAEHRDGNFQ